MQVSFETPEYTANSDALVSSIGLSDRLKADFGSGTYNGGIIGIPYNVVSGTQPKVRVIIDAYPGESDIMDVLKGLEEIALLEKGGALGAEDLDCQ